MKNVITVKISGEYLASNTSSIDVKKLTKVAEDLKKFDNAAVIIGGGNIWRQRDWSHLVKLSHSVSDNVGMHATVINAYALHGVLNQLKISSIVVNSLHPNFFGTDYVYNENIAADLFAKYQVIIYAGGTSLPYFSTDTTTVFRALQSNSNTIYMCKHGTDGVYDKDPNQHKDAQHFSHLTFKEYLRRNLSVIDAAAIGLCLGQNIKIYVFNIERYGLCLDLNDKDHYTVIEN